MVERNAIRYRWKTARREITLTARPLVMGILNVTPDSFSDGGLYLDPDKAAVRALAIAREGADLLDLGGESTRPGADPVPAEIELARILPVLKRLQGKLAIPISVDTYKAQVAQAALENGAEIINDVSGGQWDPELWSVVLHYRAGYVLTHSKGMPKNMYAEAEYTDVTEEVFAFLVNRLKALEALGLSPCHVACDVGFGFGKKAEHNLLLLANLDRFAQLGRPILVGLSRKSFLKKIAAEGSLSVCTRAAEVWAASRGACIWRVHEVADAVCASRLIEALANPGSQEP
jgi:dihydropteroate synthase